MMSYEPLSSKGFHDFTAEPEFEGVLVKKEFDIGVNKSAVYTFEPVDGGGEMKIWGATALDNQMERVDEGMRVRIEYKGMKDSPKRTGKKYKDFQVLVWKD